MQTHTSQPLSKWLHKKGFRGESEYFWYDVGDKPILASPEHEKIIDLLEPIDADYKRYPAYDLLWDICIKYGKEIFGEEPLNSQSPFYPVDIHTGRIVRFILGGQIEKAEQYIKDNSIL